MHGTLNFCDDPTHVKLVEISKVIDMLLERKFRIIKAGRRRNHYRIAMMPIVVVYHLVKYRKIFGGAFWDIFGFADQVLAQRIRSES